MKNKNSERRLFTRIPFQSKATLYDAANYWECQLMDISLKGILLEAPEDWKADIGDKFSLDLVLRVSDQDDIENRIHMYIIKLAHLEGNHAGFRWENIDIDSFTHLRKLLELNAENPELLDKEIFNLSE
ncbi:MAG: PilZ domain-containing protein [Calditrichia bacterium]|nr:PilZ domain-containing protein [Calditrichia bacterium]